MTTATYSVTDFGFGLVQHRATFGALVAVGVAPAGLVPRRWTVTRIARRRCALKADFALTVKGIADLAFCDVGRLANVVRRGLHEQGIALRGAA